MTVKYEMITVRGVVIYCDDCDTRGPQQQDDLSLAQDEALMKRPTVVAVGR